ncbi:MAG: menaquinone biosynthesis protein [Phycisphaerales bacterium]|nr:menaquinone biosynthesis protein [Phycisphaerales bacterium]
MQKLSSKHMRIGVVDFLNTVPMIDGISFVEGVELIKKVPSELIGCLERNEVDVALASSIDYQRSNSELCILPVGVLSSDGETLTVRLCSRKPFDEISKVYCDSDSHTSVALLQIIFNKAFSITPEIVSLNIRELGKVTSDWPETVLMIGDKVVTNNTESEYKYQLDLGRAWRDQTGLPFVFATWFGLFDLNQNLVNKISMLLDRQLRFNSHKIEEVVSANAIDRGWNVELANSYLTNNMQYEFTDEHKQSLKLFYDLSYDCGAIDKVTPLRFFGDI